MAVSERPDSLHGSVIRVLKAQVAMTIVLLVGVLFWSSPHAAIAAAYGAALGMVGTLISARSARRSSDNALERPEVALVPVYSGAVQKLLLVAAGVALGIVSLALYPLYLVIGLALVQLGYVAAAVVAGGTTD